MTTSVLVINGLQKLFKVMAYRNRSRKVCRIYDPQDVTIPEKLLEESFPGSNLFKDKVAGRPTKRYLHTREGMVAI